MGRYKAEKGSPIQESHLAEEFLGDGFGKLDSFDFTQVLEVFQRAVIRIVADPRLHLDEVSPILSGVITQGCNQPHSRDDNFHFRHVTIQTLWSKYEKNTFDPQ